MALLLPEDTENTQTTRLAEVVALREQLALAEAKASRAEAAERDLHEQLTAARAFQNDPLRLREQQALLILNEMYQFVALLDTQGNELETNQTSLDAVGLRREDCIGHLFWEIPVWPHSILKDLQASFQHVITTGEFMRFEVEFFAPGKELELLTTDITLKPIRNSQGEVTFVVLEGRDITQNKWAEAEIVRKNEELEVQSRRVQEANRLKSEFLANMSHELRTPLNAIMGFTQLIYNEDVGPISEEQKEYLGDILSSSRHLLQLINDVLDLAKVEAGKMTFYPEEIDLDQLVGEVRDILRPLINSKHIHFGNEIDTTLNGVVIDPAKLKQVLYNYLSNAIKFTPEEGQVTIRLRAEGEDAFRLEVEDSGIGIQPENLGRLFVEFQQLDAGMTKQYQGTGLGLALTRRIVEAQGGKVGVHSTPGQGSTFFATLPRIATVMVERDEEEDVAEQMLSLPERPGAPSVLIVEDEPRDRRQLIRAFTDAGYHVEVAATGTQALAQCRQRPFDVITLDLLLPDLSGWEVLRAIRGEGPNREVPVIVVTLVTEKEVGLGFPIQDVLNKPVTLEQVFSSLERVKKSPPVV